MLDREKVGKAISTQRKRKGMTQKVVVPKIHCEKAIKIIEKYHKCYIMGKIKKDDAYPNEKVWMEGVVKW